jgi:hypothetical protein
MWCPGDLQPSVSNGSAISDAGIQRSPSRRLRRECRELRIAEAQQIELL